MNYTVMGGGVVVAKTTLQLSAAACPEYFSHHCTLDKIKIRKTAIVFTEGES